MSQADQIFEHLKIDILERPTPVYMIGDSHSLIFKDLLFKEQYFFDKTFLAKTGYCSGLAASSFVTSDLQLNPEIIDVLRGECLIDQDLKAFHLSKTETSHALITATDDLVKEPIIVLFCGDIDLRSVFLRRLGAKHDFILPFEVDLEQFEPVPDAQNIPFELVLDLAQKMLKPLSSGLSLLKNMGFSKLFLHCLAPQTLDDEAYERINGYHSPLVLRYKATILFNHLLEKLALEANVHFVNTWPEVTENNRLNPRFFLDHIHLNKHAAKISLRKILSLQTFINPEVIKEQYEYFYEQALISFSTGDWLIDEEILEEFNQQKIVIVPQAMGQGRVQSILDTLTFELDVGNKHCRLDWGGNEPEPFSSNVLTAQPQIETLKLVHDFIYEESIACIFHSCCQYHYVIPTCRFFHSLPHQLEGDGPQKFHFDGAPPGAIRAIIYLSDVDKNSGPFEYLNSKGEVKQVLGPAGTLFIFDANAILHRGSPPRSGDRKVIDFVILPHFDEYSELVLWPGMNHWPVDPFHFTLHNYVSYPELSESVMMSNKRPVIWQDLSENSKVEIQMFFDQIEQFYQESNWKAIHDTFLNYKLFQTQILSTNGLLTYYIASAIYRQSSSEYFKDYVQNNQKLLMTQQPNSVYGSLYNHYLEQGESTSSNYPMDKMGDKEYCLMVLGEQLDELSINLNKNYLLIFDSEDQTKIQKLKAYSQQIPEFLFHIIQRESIGPDELLGCILKSKELVLHQKPRREVFEMALIYYLSQSNCLNSENK